MALARPPLKPAVTPPPASDVKKPEVKKPATTKGN